MTGTVSDLKIATIPYFRTGNPPFFKRFLSNRIPFDLRFEAGSFPQSCHKSGFKRLPGIIFAPRMGNGNINGK